MEEQRGRRATDFRPLSSVDGSFQNYREEFVEAKCLETYQVDKTVEKAISRADLYREAYWHGVESMRHSMQWSTVATHQPRKPSVKVKYDSHWTSKDGKVMLIRAAIVNSRDGYALIEFYTMSWV